MGRLLDEDDVVDWLLKRTEMYDATGHFVDENVVKKNIESQIAKIPSAQPEEQHGRVFKGIVVEYPSYYIYPEYIGKPYFSIKYTENGQEFIGYGTYKPEVLSEYLKEYFMPSAQPEPSTEIQEILEYLDSTLHPIVSPDNWYVYAELHDMVSKLPSAQPQRTGYWIEDDDEMFVICSECGEKNDYISAFCPDCGAKMINARGEQDE